MLVALPRDTKLSSSFASVPWLFSFAGLKLLPLWIAHLLLCSQKRETIRHFTWAKATSLCPCRVVRIVVAQPSRCQRLNRAFASSSYPLRVASISKMSSGSSAAAHAQVQGKAHELSQGQAQAGVEESISNHYPTRTRSESPPKPGKLRYITSQEAVQIDEALMSPEVGAFSIDQLMELAGLSCAQTVHACYPPTQFPIVLVAAGPGNQGGDGLVAARHLSHFGYNVNVWYPKEGKTELFKVSSTGFPSKVRSLFGCKNLMNTPFPLDSDSRGNCKICASTSSRSTSSKMPWKALMWFLIQSSVCTMNGDKVFCVEWTT